MCDNSWQTSVRPHINNIDDDDDDDVSGCCHRNYLSNGENVCGRMFSQTLLSPFKHNTFLRQTGLTLCLCVALFGRDVR